MKRWLERRWYRRVPPPSFLLPLAALYGAFADRVAVRRKAAAVRLPVPVIVVGNISVGGTGKTPFTIFLVEQLRALGWRPGVISRGYAGRTAAWPLRVTPSTDPALCGDEPALIARLAAVPVAVAPDRVAAARMLLEEGGIDILVADDGLQHYRLARDLEICVIDGARGLGNGARLPAGPLRERPARLATVDLVVSNGVLATPIATTVPMIEMRLAIAAARSLAHDQLRPLASFARQRVHAVAGIGNPARFFAALTAAGLEVIAHPFPDHHRYAAIDLCFDDDLPVLMTEKDAVKCAELGLPRLWAVPARAALDPAAVARVRELLTKLRR